ncbi:MAG: hypothetical protein O6934_04830 [SAR324 cluster bacterium]|nr:hypothetical protein [SAR324 cluster bacterium]
MPGLALHIGPERARPGTGNDDRITALLREAHFPRTVFEIYSRQRGVIMPVITQRFGKAQARHRADRIMES